MPKRKPQHVLRIRPFRLGHLQSQSFSISIVRCHVFFSSIRESDNNDYSPYRMVQVSQRRLQNSRRMRVNGSDYGKIHGQHVHWKGGKTSPISRRWRNNQLRNFQRVFVWLSSQKKDCFLRMECSCALEDHY